MPVKKILIFLLLISHAYLAYSQDKITVTGRITDTTGSPINSVFIKTINALSQTETITDPEGFYRLTVPPHESLTIRFSHVKYQTLEVTLDTREKTTISLNRVLKYNTRELPTVVVQDSRSQNLGLTRIDPKLTTKIPTITDPVTALVLSSGGASTTSEFTSQYNVRGGNFDENLIYVNDIEIFRPLLVRSGQQEGLSFVNSALVNSILFSAGGFESKYGDKISSALDIQYKKPTKFAGSASFSLLSNSIHLEDKVGEKFTYLIGVRQKSNTYLLNSMQTQGDYSNMAGDLQTLLTYNFSPKWSVSVLGNVSLTKYGLVPSTRETSFGSFDNIVKMTMYFEGQEIDHFNSAFGAITTTYKPTEKTHLKFTFSGFSSRETEYYDILGEYFLNKIEIDYDEKNMGKEGSLIGVGGYREHARDELFSRILNFEHRGLHFFESGAFSWGIKVQNELIDDKISEWKLFDSAGYAVPNPTQIPGDTNSPEAVRLQNVIKATNSISMLTLSGFVQKDWNFDLSNEDVLTLTAGIRFNYMDFTKEFLPSPRLQLSYKPHKKRNLLFRTSTGVYVQPPFYREMRLSYDTTTLNLKAGSIYPNAKAQKSIHVVAGMDYFFILWGRQFKLVSELYYKYLWDMVPYTVNDVRISYYPDQTSTGYAVGIDNRLSGEFIPGVDSWVSMSIMSTQEDIKGDFYYDKKTGERVEPGFIPRPTDQRFNINIFFQDYLPSYPFIKVNLNFVFGTGLPVGAPNVPKYLQTMRMPSYKRVDIGTAVVIKGEDGLVSKNRMKYLKNITASLEVFNLLNIENVISYTWVADFENYYYAVPNYLTPRRINVKLSFDF